MSLIRIGSLFFLLLSSFLQVNAQEIPDKARNFYTLQYIGGTTAFLDTVKITKRLGDTTEFTCRSGGKINSKRNFLKISDRIYLLSNSDTILMYDYSLLTGDTFRYKPQSSDSDIFVVDSVITRTLNDGKSYKHWYLHSLNDKTIIYNRIWIENLGDAIMGWDYSSYKISHYPGLNIICSDAHQLIYFSERTFFNPTCNLDSLKRELNVNTHYLNKNLLYPQPAQNELQVKLYATSAHYEIYDAQGRLVQKGSTGGSIQVDSLIPGYYVLLLTEAEHSRSFRFLKE